MQVLRSDQVPPVPVPVVFTGNGAAPFAEGDIGGGNDNGPDGNINIDDWTKFKLGFGSDLTGLTQVQRYLKGDFNDNGVIDLIDTIAFEGFFDAAQGPGAFRAMLASVPEPSSLVLCLIGVVALVVRLSSTRARRGGAMVRP